MDDELTSEEITYLHQLADTHGEDGRAAHEKLRSMYEGLDGDVEKGTHAGDAAAHDHGSFEHLRRWWNEGAGGKIAWGTPGDFDKCVRMVSKYIDPAKAPGFCQNRHIDATGHPAGHAPAEEAAHKGLDLQKAWDGTQDLVGSAIVTALEKAGFNPAQPRGPGGQWGSGGSAAGGGGAAAQGAGASHSSGAGAGGGKGAQHAAAAAKKQQKAELENHLANLRSQYKALTQTLKNLQSQLQLARKTASQAKKKSTHTTHIAVHHGKPAKKPKKSRTSTAHHAAAASAAKAQVSQLTQKIQAVEAQRTQVATQMQSVSAQIKSL